MHRVENVKANQEEENLSLKKSNAVMACINLATFYWSLSTSDINK